MYRAFRQRIENLSMFKIYCYFMILNDVPAIKLVSSMHPVLIHIAVGVFFQITFLNIKNLT